MKALRTRRRLDQQPGSGRADVTAARLLREAMIRSTDNPLLQTIYKALRPEIEESLKRSLGPNSKTAKSLKKAKAMKQDLASRFAGEL